ncbi:L-fuculose phosphate aldolase [bioreactor metagenome]|uniref:L-fuculose phosphate aldolase n=1 Tax=bioreactor metagenome TaxID=1076179 RepID=A0A644YRS4_9ZZZZ
MDFFTRTPAEQIASVMRRVYDHGLTTATGGNISVLDERGDIWITPKAVDKGSLTEKDIVCVHPDGTYEGIHAPSSEIFFHRATYRARPDFRAVVHAHPVYCIAFSLTRTLPRIDLLPHTYSLCRNMRLSKYAMMGSPALGDNLYTEFAKGADVVFLENHGVCVGGENLLLAYQLFETIEYAAKLDLLSRKTGAPFPLTQAQMEQYSNRERPDYRPLTQRSRGAAEQALRADMVQKLRRGCEHALLTGATGVCSARLDVNSFLITPEGLDLALLTEDDLVLVCGENAEEGKHPSVETPLHAAIYAGQQEVQAVFSAAPVHVMAFAASLREFATSTVPESYYMLRAVPKCAYEEAMNQPETAATRFSAKMPVVLFDHYRIVTTGETLFTAFDRMEVAEATAASILTAQDAGTVILLNESEIRDLRETFHLG